MLMPALADTHCSVKPRCAESRVSFLTTRGPSWALLVTALTDTHHLAKPRCAESRIPLPSARGLSWQVLMTALADTRHLARPRCAEFLCLVFFTSCPWTNSDDADDCPGRHSPSGEAICAEFRISHLLFLHPRLKSDDADG
jgi:hypothetical protein